MIITKELVSSKTGIFEKFEKDKQLKYSSDKPIDGDDISNANRGEYKFFTRGKNRGDYVPLIQKTLNEVCEQLKYSQQMDLDYLSVLSVLQEAQEPLEKMFKLHLIVAQPNMKIIQSKLEEIFSDEGLVEFLNQYKDSKNINGIKISEIRYILNKLCELTKIEIPSEHAKKTESCAIS